MTEYTIGIDGVEIPSIVPTLTKQEIDAILTHNRENPLPRSIIQKAIEHARQRRKQGLSPFYD